jgi:tetratricopeptide (TPR) repeat protein
MAFGWGMGVLDTHPRGRLRLTASVLVLAASLGAPAHAQSVQQPESDAARQGLGARAAAAAAAAAQLAPLGPDERVTYEQVLAAPNDVGLNYRFAQSEVRAGRLKSADAALERILSLHPDLAQVRLLRAVVLFRLDADAEAARELAALARLDLPADVRAQVEAYQAAIEKRQRRTRWTATISVGVQGDSNRSATPTDQRVLFLDTPLTLSDGAEADAAGLALGALRVEHDLGFQERHTAFAQATGFLADQAQVERQSFQYFAGETGLRLNLPADVVIPSMTLEHMRLQGEPYLTVYGPRLRIEHRIDAAWDVHMQAQYRYQDYNDVSATVDGLPVAPLAALRSGWRFDGEVGAAWTLTPVHRLALTAQITNKTAELAFEAYEGVGLQLEHTWLLGAGQFLLTTFSAGVQDYDGPDGFVSARTRRDRLYLGRVTYGVPLGTLAADAPEGWRDLVLTASVEALRADSNLPNYDYTNARGQLLLTKRWEF